MKYGLILVISLLLLCSCTKPIDRHPDAKALFEEIRITSQKPVMPEVAESLEKRLAAMNYPDLKDSIKVAQKLLMDTEVYVKTGSTMIDPSTGEEYSNHTEMDTYLYSTYKENKEELTGYFQTISQEKDLNIDKVKRLWDRYHWDMDICKLIAKREVRVGFNKAQVTEAKGKPQSVTENEKGNDVYAVWFYTDGALHFTNNNLSSIVNGEREVVQKGTGNR